VSQALVKDPNNIRIAMLGMVDGNGHPFSWSAIINGRYNSTVMADCGYPAIPEYLGAQSPENLGIQGASVTHVWCDQPEHTKQVADAAYIPHIVDQPEDVIGHVDAVIIATDIGREHVERVRPYFDAGLPVFIDKPLTDNRDGLQQFTDWHRSGKRFMSSSCMRYSKEFIGLRERMHEIGEPRAITVLMAKSWERYGIHALESVYSMLPPGGYEWVANTGDGGGNVVHLRHHNGVDVVLITTTDLYGAFGVVQLAGTKGSLEARFTDTFYAFKSQLVEFVSYLRTGVEPQPFEQLREQMAVIIAGTESRSRNGERVYLKEILS
jgi:predicted dehydrogenase